MAVAGDGPAAAALPCVRASDDGSGACGSDAAQPLNNVAANDVHSALAANIDGIPIRGMRASCVALLAGGAGCPVECGGRHAIPIASRPLHRSAADRGNSRLPANAPCGPAPCPTSPTSRAAILLRRRLPTTAAHIVCMSSEQLRKRCSSQQRAYIPSSRAQPGCNTVGHPDSATAQAEKRCSSPAPRLQAGAAHDGDGLFHPGDGRARPEICMPQARTSAQLREHAAGMAAGLRRRGPRCGRGHLHSDRSAGTRATAPAACFAIHYSPSKERDHAPAMSWAAGRTHVRRKISTRRLSCRPPGLSCPLRVLGATGCDSP